MLIASRLFWLAGIAVLTFIMIFVLYRQFFLEKGHMIHKIMLALYACYLGGLFVQILFPSYMLRPFHFSTERVNLIPLKSLRGMLSNPMEPVINILLFLPFGFFSVLNDRVKAGRRLVNVIWRTALISAIMEILQMFIGRVTDIDDVIINTVGGFLGGAICVIWHKTRLDHTGLGEKVMPELPKRWRGRMAIPLISIVALVCYGGGLISANAFVTRRDVTKYTAEIGGIRHGFSLEADYAMLCDRADDSVLFAVNATEKIYPASTMKMVTCLTALDIADPDEAVTVGTEIMRVPIDCSRAGISIGTTYTVRELLAGAMLPSGADACYALGVYCGRILTGNPGASDDEALEAFIAAANEKLRSLGATDTMMYNVEGLDEEGQLTTAQDLYRISSAVLDDPVLSRICATAEMDIGPKENTVHLKNTNMIIRTESEYFSGDCVGIKTGSTSKAGNCLVSAFTKNGKRYIAIVMHSGYEGKFKDTLTLAGLV